MKISTKKVPFEYIEKIKKPKHRPPLRPMFLLTLIVRIGAIFDLFSAKFKYTTERMEKTKGKPCLILMNHSSFIDLKIVSKIMFPRRYCIVCTSDGFVGFGKELLMRLLGCIPTNKFVSNPSLISDMRAAFNKNVSVLMYPEASYSFDGTATPLPRKMGFLLKKLNVPVVSIITEGAFSREPLYNCLQKRDVKVSAHVKCLFTPEELKEKSVAELDAILDETFNFDGFAWQKKNKIEIKEDFRADGLNRILYKCASCGNEGKMEGKGTKLLCHHCKKEYEMDIYGSLKASNGETEFSHIPDWYAWQRQEVRKEILEGSYKLETDVDIGVLVDYKAIYMVGEGKLTHTPEGFELIGCNGKLNYTQKAMASYSLYSDYYWYEIGDVICIGNNDILYYCFPKCEGDVVAKARIAAEEIYKIGREKRNKKEK